MIAAETPRRSLIPLLSRTAALGVALGAPTVLLTFATVGTFLVLTAFRRDLFLESP